MLPLPVPEAELPEQELLQELTQRLEDAQPRRLAAEACFRQSPDVPLRAVPDVPRHPAEAARQWRDRSSVQDAQSPEPDEPAGQSCDAVLLAQQIPCAAVQSSASASRGA